MGLNPYQDVIVDSICGDIKKSLDNNIIAGSVILTYSAIDAMAFLAMPASQKKVGKKDFIHWVDEYLKADENQPYQYRGIDLYGARCGIVHRYGVESELSENGKCNMFCYSSGSEHIYKSEKHKTLVILSYKRLINDFFKAVQLFIQDMKGNEDLKSKVDGRIESLFIISKKGDL